MQHGEQQRQESGAEGIPESFWGKKSRCEIGAVGFGRLVKIILLQWRHGKATQDCLGLC